jgi:hypothetical protein
MDKGGRDEQRLGKLIGDSPCLKAIQHIWERHCTVVTAEESFDATLEEWHRVGRMAPF